MSTYLNRRPREFWVLKFTQQSGRKQEGSRSAASTLATNSLSTAVHTYVWYLDNVVASQDTIGYSNCSLSVSAWLLLTVNILNDWGRGRASRVGGFAVDAALVFDRASLFHRRRRSCVELWTLWTLFQCARYPNLSWYCRITDDDHDELRPKQFLVGWGHLTLLAKSIRSVDRMCPVLGRKLRMQHTKLPQDVRQTSILSFLAVLERLEFSSSGSLYCLWRKIVWARICRMRRSQSTKGRDCEWHSTRWRQRDLRQGRLGLDIIESSRWKR